MPWFAWQPIKSLSVRALVTSEAGATLEVSVGDGGLGAVCHGGRAGSAGTGLLVGGRDGGTGGCPGPGVDTAQVRVVRE